MPIRWNTLKVTESADMVEDFLNQAVEPLECARNVAREALKIDSLPQYISDGFNRVISDIDRAIGGSQWEPVGRIRAGIAHVRDNIPSAAFKSDQAKQKQGEQQTLM